MGLFALFRKKKQVKKKRNKQPGQSWSSMRQEIRRTGTAVESLQAQIGTINIVLKKHDDQLVEHNNVIEEHSKGLEKLEQMLNAIPVRSSAQPDTPSSGLPQMAGVPVAAKSTIQQLPQKLDIDRFSEQEKRILAVFFQNKAARLSYLDVASALNKSHYTIKNQMRQIRQKADLFDQTTGRQCRNLFKLKNDLRIEKYLNIGQPIERPAPTSWSPRSNAQD